MENKVQKRFFIFIGRSGGGKGTQAQLLKTYLEGKGYESVQHITTGGGFRAFIQGDSHVAALARDINDRGGLQPEFLAVWNWSNIFINTLKGNETVILDGAPRKTFEIEVLHSAVNFFGYENPVVIYLDVPEGVSREHLKSRGRSDDLDEKNTDNKMSWFDTDIIPTIDAYLRDPRYKVLHIKGNQTIEEVHKEIVTKIEEL